MENELDFKPHFHDADEMNFLMNAATGSWIIIENWKQFNFFHIVKSWGTHMWAEWRDTINFEGLRLLIFYKFLTLKRSG